MKKQLLFLGACTALGTFAACGDETSVPNVGSARSAIVNGAADATRPDVLLMQDDTIAGFRCTATLIAPNLVITARHCVGQRSTGETLCEGDGTSNGAGSLPNYLGDAPAAPMNFATAPGQTPLAHGKAIFDDNATTTCAHDLALIELDTPITTITPTKLRRSAVSMNDSLLVMGFGWTDRNATINATQRMKASTTVLALGPSVFTFAPNGDTTQTPVPLAVAGGEIGVSGVTMTGDSGGPAFDKDGNLAAIVSRGFSDALYGPATFTTIAAHLPVIDMALAATGNAPDGGDTLPPADAAAPPQGDGGGAVTVRADSGAEDGGVADESTTSDSGGCAVSTRTPSRSGAALLALLALVTSYRRASRRRPNRCAACTSRRR